MSRCVLYFDIGNTNTKIGVGPGVGEPLAASYVLPSDERQTADQFGLTLLDLLRHMHLEPADVADCVASSVVPGMGVEIIVLAFAVVVIGGMGSIEGAAVGALLVGLSRAAAVHYAPEFELFVIYGVMALVLAVRPQGLFGRVLARKI